MNERGCSKKLKEGEGMGEKEIRESEESVNERKREE